MKKLLAVLIILFLIIIFSIYALKINKESSKRALEKYNNEYEFYLNKTIYGADLATIINKVINLNESNKVQKDEKNYYIENEENSIKIEIKMSLTEKTYPMEEIYNKNTAEFVKYFNVIEFKCTSIEYHKETGKISKMFFEQVEK
ncbi:MAG: hypothetical protein ACI4VP_00815 [Clostridia bacterium]